MRRGWILGLVLAAAWPAAAGEGIFVVSGAVPVGRTANGVVQDVTDLGGGRWLVQVGTELGPVSAGAGASGSSNPVSPAFLAMPRGFRLPRSLSRSLPGRTDVWRRATAVLEWVQRRVRVEENEMAPQDARSVLRRGTARCSGLANAAVALLRAAGIPARPVSGLLVTDEGPIPHRWLEAHLGGMGWVPTDPTLGLWVITPRHVACGEPVVGPAAVEVRTLVDDDLASLPRRGRWPCRPGRGASLLVRVVPGTGRRGRVVLDGPGGERRMACVGDRATFAELPPGRWMVSLEVDGRRVRRVGVDLKDGDVRSLRLIPRGEGAPS